MFLKKSSSLSEKTPVTSSHYALLIPRLFKPSIYRDTPEYWYRRLCMSQRPKDLTRPLLSKTLAFEMKVKILLAIPDSTIKSHVEIRWLESTLERCGYHQLAQLVRWRLFWLLGADYISASKQWSQRVVTSELELCWILQREAYIQEETELLRKLDDIDPAITSNQITAYETELRDLNGFYWGSIKLTAKIKRNLPSQMVRPFNACRSNPAWYLCSWMRLDCASQGGCCGRECGCCERTYRGHPRGHCTSACGCCIRTEGRLTSEYDRPIHAQDYPFDIEEYQSPYSQRLFRAYIWGLSFLDEMGLPGTYW